MLDCHIDPTDQLSLIYLGARVCEASASKAGEIMKRIHELMWDKRLEGQKSDDRYRHLHKFTGDTLKKQTENVENYLFEKYLCQHIEEQQRVYEDLSAAGIGYRSIGCSYPSHLDMDAEAFPKHQPIRHNPPQTV